MKLSLSDIQRFWRKVDKRDQAECWGWTGGIYGSGYGSFYLHGTYTGAHRVSWMMKYGEIPEGMLVCHSCDNRKCVNPGHLWVGTHKQNMRDMVNKSRQRFVRKVGERNGFSKLTDEEVRAIRERYRNGETQTTLARDYSTSQSNIGRIVNRESWGHVAASPVERGEPSEG